MTVVAGRSTETSGDGTADRIDLPAGVVVVIVIPAVLPHHSCVCCIKRCFAPNGVPPMTRRRTFCTGTTTAACGRQTKTRSGHRGPSFQR